MSYERDIFYQIDKLPLEQGMQLLRGAKELAYEWWTDILDCSVSYARQRVEMEFEEALKKVTENTFLFFIHRRGYDNWKWHLELGYRTMTSTPDYFLWIRVDEEKIEQLVEKYNLEKMA